MKQLPRILMVAAVAALLMLFVFPMWKIVLIAPQYPHGVTMYIWINKIGGDEPGTLQNVNILNHYVGMKFIEPESIPELKYFPYIIMGLAALGLIVAGINKRWAYWSWCLIFAALAVVGIYDFYLWEYDYGHNLSPNAPIKIPGASFQPPLIGTKVILNFIAKSFPATGGYFAGLAFVLAMIAGWQKGKMKRTV
jgi:copper chaperone NosL